MNRLLAVATLALYAGLLTLPGCKDEKGLPVPNSPSTAGGPGGRRQVAVIPKGTTHAHWAGVKAGAERAGKELGVDISWQGPLREGDREGQIKVVEQFVSDGVAGIVLAPTDDKALLRPARRAAAKGIPVVIFDSPLAGELGKDFVALVATDNKKAGHMGGRRLAELLGGKGKVVLLRYQENSASTDQREAGFLEAMKEHPAVTLTSANQYAGDTADTAQKKAEAMLDTLREADGIFCPNESSTQGMLTALDKAGLLGADRKVKFVGFDTSDPLLKALEAGKIQGLVAQNPQKMGYDAVRTLVGHLDGTSVRTFVDTGAVVVTKENLGSEEVRSVLAR